MHIKKIYIAYTGGTIGMKPSDRGWVPDPEFPERMKEKIPELLDPTMPEYTIHMYDPLLDSSNMTPGNWKTIADDIKNRYHDFDGFIVLHGTDTMAFTSSALAFMLDGLEKPVILTGSQIPLWEVRSDARENIITSLQIAASHPVREVCLYFNNFLLRGCRSVKVNSDGFDAFASPNYPPLGTIGINFEISIADEYLIQRDLGAKELMIHELAGPNVGILRLFPGIQAGFVKSALEPLDGAILQAYGVGNGPDKDKDFLKVLENAVKIDKKVIVDCTQCLRGTVNLGDYATGSALARAGVISGFDMTTEAALAKLYYLIKKGLPGEDVKKLMMTDLRGELTNPDAPKQKE